MNPIVEKYSELAGRYDEDGNRRSCWGEAADRALASIRIEPSYRSIVDVGCGTGRALARLAPRGAPHAQWIGIEPAANMRARAVELTRHHPTVRIMDGSFEQMPLASGSVDYLYSILAFHWTTDPRRSVAELARVLAPAGAMDLFFIGRQNGHEFIRKTTPIFLKHMGPALLLESAGRRKQLTREAAGQLFAEGFGGRQLTVEETHTTYYDTLDGHWNWWVRIEGHFVDLPPDARAACDREVKQALSTLQGEAGIPYTIHLLHVRVR